MTTTNRSVPWLIPAAAVCGLLFSYAALATWNKVDWCRGWSQHYAASAGRMRAEAQERQRPLAERTELLVAAEWHDMIAAKYARVAARPWLPYLKAPLITEADKAEAQRRTAAARAALAP